MMAIDGHDVYLYHVFVAPRISELTQFKPMFQRSTVYMYFFQNLLT